MSGNGFSGATILVTGAASGIGAATAGLLAARGAQEMILVDRDEAGLARFAASLPCRHRLAMGDVAEEALWQGLDLSGLTHALVNAGIGAGGRIADSTFADWRKVISANLDGAFLTLQAAFRAMQGRGGAIVLTASAAGIKAEPGIAAYGASKAGVIQLARIAAKEGGPDNIRVNAIAPGGVKTPIWASIPFFQHLVVSQGSEEAAFEAMAGGPGMRFAAADEIAGQIAFLLSDDARSITGACMVSDGGYSL